MKRTVFIYDRVRYIQQCVMPMPQHSTPWGPSQNDHLIIIMGISVHGKDGLYIGRGLEFSALPSWAHAVLSWWRHQMETISALLALCKGNPPISGCFPSQKPEARRFWLRKRSRRRWFETPLRSIWHHCNGRSYIFSDTSCKEMSLKYEMTETLNVAEYL